LPPADSSPYLRHVLDHIIARQHGGETEFHNLALICMRCNQHKGPNVAGIDPQSGSIVSLFHPRRDSWNEHFRYEGAVLVGLTPAGRATITVLAINMPLRVAARQALIEAGAVM
jgi:hypothetical protein